MSFRFFRKPWQSGAGTTPLVDMLMLFVCWKCSYFTININQHHNFPLKPSHPHFWSLHNKEMLFLVKCQNMGEVLFNLICSSQFYSIYTQLISHYCKNCKRWTHTHTKKTLCRKIWVGTVSQKQTQDRFIHTIIYCKCLKTIRCNNPMVLNRETALKVTYA